MENPDCGYLKIALENTSEVHVEVKRGEIIARLVFTQIDQPRPIRVEFEVSFLNHL